VTAVANADNSPDVREGTAPGPEPPLGDEARSSIRAHASPEGIVTILFTDIVESSRFRQRLGDAAAQERMREHNAVVREKISACGGFEVKAQGDGFMIAFSDAAAALACAVDIQKAVADDNERHPGGALHVRMGLNCGQVIKEEEDFFGGAVIVAARICAMAKGGQILVSEAVRVLAGLPQGIGYVRYGQRRLKGLAHAYGIWSVPWGGEEPRGLARLPASPGARIAAFGIVALVAAGAVAAAIIFSRGSSGGSDGAAAPQQLAIGYKARSTARVVGGDCKAQDLVIRGAVDGEITGDLAGHVTGSGDVTAYVSDNCQTGYSKTDLTLADTNGNTLNGTLEGPLNALTLFTQSPDEETKAGYGTSVFTITGGTGVYEGASGVATCNGVITGRFQPDGTVLADTEGDCKGQLVTTASSVVAPEPLVVQLAATPLKVALSTDTSGLANSVGLAVVYGNTRDTTQSGLVLTVPSPPGATIIATALGESHTPTQGERTWKLPDVAPGELKRFEFRIRILSAPGTSVPLTAQIVGDGFDHPVTSNVVTIQVTP
jgi:class 3 adenylate cyclase